MQALATKNAPPPGQLARTKQPTYDSYVRVFNRQHLGPVTVEAVTAYILGLKKKRYRAATIANVKAALKKSFRLTFKEQAQDVRFLALLDASFKEIKTAKPKKEINKQMVIAESEKATLIEAMPERLGLIVEALSVTGLRISELLGITLRDCEKVKDEGKPFVSALVLGKGKKERRVFFTPDLFDRIRSTFKGEDFLFVNRSGNALSRFYVHRQIKGYGLKVLKRKIRPHFFRHSWATKNIATLGLGKASRYLGHASAATTIDMYDHAELSPSELYA